MRKNGSMFYALFALAIVVIIGIIFLKKGNQIPSGVEETQPSKIGAVAKTSVERETGISETPNATSGESNASQNQKSDVKGDGLAISGIITLSGGAPAAQATISLAKIEIGESPFSQVPVSNTTADKNGRYSISVRNYPVIFVKASCPGYATLTSVTGSATSRKKAPSSEKKGEVIINFTLPPASYVKGVVVDENDKFIEGISMTFLFQDRQNENYSLETTSTNEKGRFEFLNIPPGKIMLGAASLDHAPISREFTAPADDIILKLPRATASLSGRVFHKITGEPVTSATVRLGYSWVNLKMPMKMRENEILTDSTGFYSFEKIPKGQYFIKAEKKGLCMLAASDLPNNILELKENEKREGLIIFLYEGHTIKGRVTEKINGAPIEGVKVRSAWGIEKPVEDITDAEGFYILKGLSGNKVGLTAEKENYFLVEEEKHIYHRGIELHPEKLELTQDIQMISGLFISGRVETEGGEPATNAHVSLYQLHGDDPRREAHPVDHIGAFQFAVAPFNPCIVKAVVEGFPVAFSDPIDVQEKSIENIIIKLKQGASISGVVQDEEKKSVEGAKVITQIPMRYGKYTNYERLEDQATLSDSNGQFKAENLPPGEIILIAEKEGYAKSEEEKISVKSGEKKKGVILQLTNSALLAGRITDPIGNPLHDVHVYVNCASSGKNSDGFAQTDEDGYYRIEGLYNAPHNIQLRHKDYGEDFHQNIEVGREDADFVMGANKITLIGNVKDWKTKNPIADFKVSCGEFKPENDPNIPGRFIIRNFSPNFSYPFKIESEGYLPYITGLLTFPEGENLV
ncbi:carboxypeptidase regulatory-like domain-containing protein, partial [Candidatus Sumerlaeota bacterium]|nr:carboxypeptidase regulatory-like domain-containing protein [Candidatus Sumerlaeota bacterium]